MRPGSYIRTPEILEKQRNAQKGRPAKNKGVVYSQEIRNRISEGTKKAMMSPEIRNKISISKIGKKMPEGFGKKISLAGGNLKRRGVNAYNWKGGRVDLDKQIRKSLEYRQWRSDVFTNDNYTCQDCGIRGVEFHAHHNLKSFCTILDENNIKTLEDALKCSELWDLNNGKTLCIPCHKKTETYGLNKKWYSKIK